MANKFNPDDLKNPLYEHSQVVTARDLQIIYFGLAEQYKDTKWWEFKRKRHLAVAGHVVWEILMWLQGGKPALRDIGDIK